MCQEGLRFLIRIIKKEAHRPWRLVMGIEELPQDPLQRVQGKGIEEKETVPLWRDFILHGIGQDESHAPPRRCRLPIGQSLFPQPPVILDADGLAARLISQKETDPPFAAAVIDEGVLLADIAAVGQSFENTVVRRFIRMMLTVRMTIVAASCLN